MKLSEALAVLERSFSGLEEGAPRLVEAEDDRFGLRPSAVWLEYRWYVRAGGMAEVFLKSERVRAGVRFQAEATVLRVHLLGASSELSERAAQLLVGGRPAPERLMGLFGDDGVRREVVAFGRTSVTVEHWDTPGPRPVLAEARFRALAERLADPASTPEERHEAVQRLADERSPRVVEVLLELLSRQSSLMALRVLSEWGEERSRAPLLRALDAVRPDNPADLWTLTALVRRLDAWTHVKR
ncbi:hypothetical protein HUA76_15980 [Myxococcus sp. CA056]|uniref:hypothetical protein n=1 Tax=Myxococcus sp. CA056 TaxID=2741740 RepID=UPI00157A21FE|nr:hypothetical protein [Myxococcus sp. CA056]NTX12297.1 hypothetical protein [Myxococcus sp. CA056]